VGVNVDRQDTLAVDHYRQAWGLGLRPRRIQHAATAEGYPARGSARQKIPASGHGSPPWISLAGRLTCRLILHFLWDHIAKLDTEGQSFSA
jgi:hypothetical protein